MATAFIMNMRLIGDHHLDHGRVAFWTQVILNFIEGLADLRITRIDTCRTRFLFKVFVLGAVKPQTLAQRATFYYDIVDFDAFHVVRTLWTLHVPAPGACQSGELTNYPA